MIKSKRHMDIVFQNLTADPPSSRLRRASKKYTSKFFEKILNAGIKELKLGNPKKTQSDLEASKNIEVSVNLVGEAKIKQLNNKYRHKNNVTDVLSFPMSEKPSRKLHTTDLGDIFICLSFAKNEAKRENISIDRKLAQLTVHGFLHLLGYDHENSVVKARKMEKLEEAILNRLSL